VRIALGATRGDLARLFLYQTLRAVVPGLAAGWILAAIGMRAMASILFHVKPEDPAIFFCVPAMLGLVTLLAASWPLHRAVTVDPVHALRVE
jgi:ABC-type lipoprotein release transport system permease subunit